MRRLTRSPRSPAVPVNERRTVVAAARSLFTETGECPGEVIVFTCDGYPSWLEVCSWSDDVEVTLANALEWWERRL